MKRLVGAGPLRSRDFRWVFLSRAVSVFGDFFVPVALAFAVLGLNASAGALGFVLAVDALALTLGLALGGVWADRLPRRRIMVSADWVRAAVQTTVAILLAADLAAVWHLAVLYAVYGLASGFFHPASSGLVPETVGRAHLQEANALLGLASSVAAITGPVVAGLLVAGPGPAAAIALDAASFVISGSLLLRLGAGRRAAAAATTFVRDFRDGWAEFRSRPWLLAKVVHWTLFLMLAFAPLGVYGPLVAKKELGGAAAWGIIETGFAIGGILGRSVALRVKPHRPALASFSMTFLAIPTFALLAVAAPVPLIFLARMLMGAGFGFYGAVFITAIQLSVSPERLSRVTSYEYMSSMTLMPVGYALAGPISYALGLTNALWLAAAWTLASTAIVVSLRPVRTFRIHADSVTAASPLLPPRDPRGEPDERAVTLG